MYLRALAEVNDERAPSVRAILHLSLHPELRTCPLQETFGVGSPQEAQCSEHARLSAG